MEAGVIFRDTFRGNHRLMEGSCEETKVVTPTNFWTGVLSSIGKGVPGTAPAPRS